PAVGRQVRAHDARIEFLQRVVGEPQPCGQVSPQVVEHGVRPGHEPLEHAHAFGLLQVEREAALVAVEGMEEMAVVRAEEVGAYVAAYVAPFRRILDLDHLGTEVCQVGRAERAGPILFHCEDAHASQRRRTVRLAGVGRMRLVHVRLRWLALRDSGSAVTRGSMARMSGCVSIERTKLSSAWTASGWKQRPAFSRYLARMAGPSSGRSAWPRLTSSRCARRVPSSRNTTTSPV